MGNILSFTKGQGGLGRPLPGTDYIAGLLFYSGTLPSGFSSSARVKTVYSVEDAEALGIVNTSSDETKAVAKLVVTGSPAAGDTVAISYAGITGSVTVLATYTLTTADVVSTTTAAAALAAAINALTTTHGFTATNSTNSLLVTTKAGEGVFPNSGTPYSSTTTGAATYTWTQPTGSASTVLGVASELGIMYYHISEYFRMQPQGKLYVGVYATADVGTWSNISDMIEASVGEIKILGVYQKSSAFATSHLTAIQAIETTMANSTNKKPFSVIYQGDIQGTSDLSTLGNLRLLNCPNVSATIAQDGANAGYKLWKATAKSIGSVGTCVGTLAFGKCNEDISWIEKFPISNGVEYSTIAFANGDPYLTTSTNKRTQLDTYGYLFLLKEMNQPSSYWNDSHTATSPTSDYAYIELTRTIDKAIRNVRTTITPALGRPVNVDPVTGTIDLNVIKDLQNRGDQALSQMLSAGEISGYQTIINPDQNVLSTSEIEVTIEIVPTGSARTISVNIGYVTNLSTAS